MKSLKKNFGHVKNRNSHGYGITRPEAPEGEAEDPREEEEEEEEEETPGTTPGTTPSETQRPASGDLEEPLTPSHLLIGRRVLNLPDNLGVLLSDPEDEEFTVSPNQLGDRVKNVSKSLNYFWDRWRTEYLAELREAHRQSKCKLQKGTPISVGDVVVVHDEGLPRGFWKLGKIEEVYSGRDKKIRGARLKLPSGNQLRRPIQLLYPLEVHSNSETPDVESETPDVDNENPNVERSGMELDPKLDSQPNESRRRLQRAAAREAESRMRACTMQLDELDVS